MSSPARASPPALKPLAWSTAAFLGGVLLHFERLPLWATATAILCAAWSLAGHARRVRLPGRSVKVVLALALLAAVVALFHTLNGLQAGTTLLTVMGSVKLLETRTRRDRYILIGAGIYLLLAACLSRQSLLYAPLYAADAWLCCSALLAAAHPDSSLGNRAAVMLAARSLLLALPIGLIGFLFFPRLSGSLWALPDSGAALTGLSDSLTPGAISDLSESSRPAFRVWFDGPAPPPQERYWRGPVLYDFDGATWSRPPPWSFWPEMRRASMRPAQAADSARPSSTAHRYRYRIALEPSSEPWWLGLDTVVSAPPGARLTADHVLVGDGPVTHPITYTAVSDTTMRRARPLTPLTLRRDLWLPPRRNPRSAALARRLRRRAGSDAAFVQAVLDYLRTGGFEYSLTPARLGKNSVDEFLFDTRRGFCGHFASAFVTLMRAGGVPARVVVGYLGGEWNPVGRYLVVRDSDAHAWAEVWLDGRGWTRVDPTAVVAPERLYRNIDSFLPNAASASERLVLEVPWIGAVGNAWDAANAWWSDDVVGFNSRSQLALLKRLGIAAPKMLDLVWLLALSLVVWLAATAWRLGRLPHGARPDRIARSYDRLCRKLARAGVARGADQGPLAYADSIARRRPDLAAIGRVLLARYAELRYGSLASGSRERRLADFERAVACWRISPRSKNARASRGK
jgi:protein-glutamine gamma-glutamyltransferase